jgi:hypothetical protein
MGTDPGGTDGMKARSERGAASAAPIWGSSPDAICELYTDAICHRMTDAAPDPRTKTSQGCSCAGDSFYGHESFCGDVEPEPRAAFGPMSTTVDTSPDTDDLEFWEWSVSERAGDAHVADPARTCMEGTAHTATTVTLPRAGVLRMKPTAFLTIVNRGRMTSYRVTDATGRLLWATRAFSTDEGRDGARERLRRWVRATGWRVVMAGEEVRRAG